MQNTKGDNSYEDIIHLEHPTSKRHPRMSMERRAAQFAPFAALRGHKEAVDEAERLTDAQMELDEAEKEELDRTLQEILSKLDRNPKIKVTYFVPDEKKDGGAYIQYTGNLKRIDSYRRMLVLEDETEILLDHIVELEEL